MARVTHVKRAQQRYETVPVIDPETGEQKKTPVMVTRGGERVQKTTKRGRPVFLRVTKEDRSKPKPNYKCGKCGVEIKPGDPYKHISPKSGPYGGRKLIRCGTCPTWHRWEYSSSLDARLEQISYDFDQAVDAAESTDDIQSALDDAAASIEELAGEKREGADNIESGFGHPTSQSEELAEMADNLEQWSSDVSSADIPEMTQCENCDDGQVDCDNCQGTGTITADDPADEDQDCEECDGGQLNCDTCDGTGEDIEAWRDQVRDEVTIVSEQPF